MKDYKYLDVTELPSDPNGSTGSMRKQLSNAFNFARSYPSKMEQLRKILLHVLARIDDIDYSNLEKYASTVQKNVNLEKRNAKLFTAIKRHKLNVDGLTKEQQEELK